MLKRPDPEIAASSETMDTKVINVIVFQLQAPVGGLDQHHQRDPTEPCERHQPLKCQNSENRPNGVSRCVP